MPRRDRARRRDLALAVVLIAIAGTIVAFALGIEPGVRTDPLGPRAFPLALGVAIGLCGVLLGVAALAPDRHPGAAPVLADVGGDESQGAGFSPGRLVLTVAATAAYVAAFEPLGYLLATPAYVAALLLVQRGVTRGTLATVPLAVTCAFYAAFRFGLLVPVPDGVLERWLPW